VSALRAMVELPLRPESAAAARRLVSDVLTAWQLPELIPDVQLVATELISNAVKHAPVFDTVELELIRNEGTVRVHVNDGSALRPMLRAAPYDQTTGRGLRIIGAIAARWGVENRKGGKLVWAEVSRPDLDKKG
jgi:anti-sigma regulatory factor (Ser/Thr protein kinase)